MTSNDNSVNIRNYHHGDLRSAVVEEGLRLLQDREVESLSLREIARNVGVSATALYRHFPDRASLLAALANAGYAQLADEQKQAAMTTAGQEGFAALGRAYVRFAVANPSLFRLIFVNSPANMTPHSIPPSGSAASLLEQSVKAILGDDVPDAVRFTVMLRAWALVHGLAMLILDKQIDVDDAFIDQVVSTSSVGLDLPK